MKIIDSISLFRKSVLDSQRPLGLVPTMGAIHDGHMALFDTARADNTTLASSIFVNPSQFDSYEDLSTYPRDVENDLAKLEAAGVDIAFTPTVEEIYPDGFDTSIDVGSIASQLEGAHRSDHFGGVATIVVKLLNITSPDRVYFGEKDFQQCLVIKHLVSDLNMDVEIVTVPTVREHDGLAFSSRNVCLTRPERRAATVLYRALLLSKSTYQSGVTNANTMRQKMRTLIDTEPLAEIDYISITDPDTLSELAEAGTRTLVSLAVRIGQTRLIDNITLTY